MIVLAARPGMGKTAFVLTMARNITVEYNVPVAVFSLETSAAQLVQRLISAETEISSDKFRKGNLSRTIPNCTNASADSRMPPSTSTTPRP